jgi:hypothetical protein
MRPVREPVEDDAGLRGAAALVVFGRAEVRAGLGEGDVVVPLAEGLADGVERLGDAVGVAEVLVPA